MAEREFLTIQTLLSEDEKSDKSISCDDLEISSWHKSTQIGLKRTKNISISNSPILPKVPQSTGKREKVTQVQVDMDDGFKKRHPYAKVENFCDFIDDTTKASPLESLYARLRKIPKQVIGKKEHLPFLKPYTDYKYSYGSFYGHSPRRIKSVLDVVFESSSNKRFKSKESSNLIIPSPVNHILQKSMKKTRVYQNSYFDNSFILKKEQRIRNISINILNRKF